MGKTALVDAAVHAAGSREMRTFRATGRELESGFSYGVVLQLLESHIRAASPAELDVIFDGAASLARPLLLPGPELPAPDATDAVVHGLLWVVTNLAEHGPLLLAVDDLHWVDRVSLRFLHYLAGRIADLPVVVVGGARASISDEVVRSLLGHRSTVRRALEPLTEAAVSELTGTQASPEVSRVLHRLTGGNPLLVSELVENLAAVRTLGDELNAANDAVLPTVVARVGRLSEPARRLAEASAIVGDGTLRSIADDLADLSAEDAARAHAELVDAAIVTDDDAVLFVHPLVLGSVIATIERPARVGLHTRAAEIHERRGSPPEIIAAHLEHADPAGSNRTVEVLRLAAQRASKSGLAEQAAAWLERALVEGAPGAPRAALLFDIAAAEATSGNPRWREHLEDAVGSSSDPATSVPSMLRIAHRLHNAGAVADAADLAWRGFELAPPHDLRLRRRLLAAYAGAALIDPVMRPVAIRRIDDVIATGIVGDDVESRGLLAHLAYDQAIRGGPVGQPVVDDVVALARQSLQLDAGVARRQPLPNPISAILALQYCDELELADAAVTTFLEDATRRGSAISRAVASNYRAPIGFYRCRPQQAAADAEISRQGYDLGWQLASPGAAGHLALSHLELDDLDGAEAALELPAGSWEATAPYNFWLYARGNVYLAQGSYDAARDALLESGNRQQAMGATNPNVIPWRSSASTALARLGDIEGARGLVDEELELARRFGAPRGISVALRAAAAVGSADERLPVLREALAVAERSPSTIELVRVAIDLGSALRRDGDKAGAREHLRRALDLADRGCAIRLARLAREELEASGAKPRRTAITGPSALTPSERRVADLAASGRRNREIADELFVSVKAVEFHLGNAYRKLDVSSREQLLDALS